METKPKIYEALANIMAKITPIKKEKKNQQQGFMYRGIDDFMNELHSLFAENKVIIIPECIERTEDERTSKNGGALFYVKERVKYTFYAEDGSSVFAIVDGEGMDSGDKGTNKAMAVALKYCLMQMFLIPTEDLKDPDSESHEVKPKEQPKDEMSEIAKRLAQGLAELRDCKDLPDLARVWSKYKDLQIQETFSLCKDNMKKNIQKNNPNGASSSAI